MHLGLGLNLTRPTAGSGDTTGPLDSYAASSAYSLRQLYSDYSGNAILVRRSSDNATADIGFTASGALDETALLAHVGAGDGYVQTWYDQSGNARNVSQTTAVDQPRIVSSGVVDNLEGKPTLVFSGSQYLFASSAWIYAQGSATSFGVLSGSPQIDKRIMAEGSSLSTSPVYSPLQSGDNGTFSDSDNISVFIRDDTAFVLIANESVSPTGALDGTRHTYAVRDNGTQVIGYVDGTESLTQTFNGGSRTALTLNRFAIGALLRSTVSSEWTGSISEIITGPLVTPSEVADIQAEQLTFYA